MRSTGESRTQASTVRITWLRALVAGVAVAACGWSVPASADAALGYVEDGCLSEIPDKPAGSLKSPPFTLAAGRTAQVSFSSWWEIESVNPSTHDLMTVEYSTDDVYWTEIKRLNPLSDPTSPAGDARLGLSNQGLAQTPAWGSVSATIPTGASPRTIRVRFTFTARDEEFQGFRGWAIDNLLVTDSVGSTLLSQGFETSPAGWTSGGMWHQQASPQAVSVSPAISLLVDPPTAGGFLPSASQGGGVAWFGEAATGTYCGAPYPIGPPDPTPDPVPDPIVPGPSDPLPAPSPVPQPPAPETGPVPEAQFGSTGGITAGSGSVKIRPAGSDAFVELGPGKTVKLTDGSEVDVTSGAASVSFQEAPGSGSRSLGVSQGRFVFDQRSAKPTDPLQATTVTDLALSGPLPTAKSTRRLRVAVGAASACGSPYRIRVVRGRKQCGRFVGKGKRKVWKLRSIIRSTGENGSGADLGTEYEVIDSKAATTFRVFSGAIVAVGGKPAKTVNITAGKSYTFKAKPSKSKR